MNSVRSVSIIFWSRSVAGSTVVLQNGCVCCSVRSELRAGLRELIDGRAKGEVPPFDRIVIETTGLADPVPVVQTITVDPMLRNQLRLASLISTVDALNGIEQIETQHEALRQAATADRLVITKTDLSDDRQIEQLQQRLKNINPLALDLAVSGQRASLERNIERRSFGSAIARRRSRHCLKRC